MYLACSVRAGLVKPIDGVARGLAQRGHREGKGVVVVTKAGASSSSRSSCLKLRQFSRQNAGPPASFNRRVLWSFAASISNITLCTAVHWILPPAQAFHKKAVKTSHTSARLRSRLAPSARLRRNLDAHSEPSTSSPCLGSLATRLRGSRAALRASMFSPSHRPRPNLRASSPTARQHNTSRGPNGLLRTAAMRYSW